MDSESSMKVLRAFMFALGFIIYLFWMYFLTVILDICFETDILTDWISSNQNRRHNSGVDTSPDLDLDDRPRLRMDRMEASFDSPLTHRRYYVIGHFQ